MAKKIFPFWASDDISDVGDGSPNKLDPGLAKQASGWAIEKPKLQHMNWIQNLFGHFIRANNEVKSVATLVEVEVGERLIADNLTSACTVLLPTQPEDGQWVEVGGEGLYSSHSVFVDGGSIDIMIPSDTTCELDGDMDKLVFLFWYSETLSMWRIRVTKTEGAI